MRYLDLIAERPVVWALFAIYIIGTSWLAWRGHKKTSDIVSYSIGRGDMPSWLVGVTLAASLASTATFVINPGFVYSHGVSALMHLGVAAGSGIITGLLVMSVGFRRVGAKTAAITLPQWIGKRYGSTALATFFAAINLLSFTFVVLIVGGISIMMQQTMGLTNMESLLLTIVFVFGYIFIGGTYAHAYTNAFQGTLMIAVTAIILISGIPLFAGGAGEFFQRVGSSDPNLLRVLNPESNLFSTFFSVFVSGFVIGFALVCQPHIMTKALYVKSDREVWKYLGYTILVSSLFTGLLFVGLFARAAGIPESALADPATGLFRQDLAVAVYLGSTFSPLMLSFISVAILAAGMSTLDGILVALSSIAANDLVLNLTRDSLLKDWPEERKRRFGHTASQVILVLMGIAAFAVALHPPALLGIFGQLGVYGIVAASTVPILFGILFNRMNGAAALAAGMIGAVVHFALYFSKYSANPAVTATWGLLASVAAGLIGLALAGRVRPKGEVEVGSGT